MRRTQILMTVAALAISLLASFAVSAQTGQLRGHVVLTQADGTTIPAAGAQIDVYRTDLSGKYSLKADKKGLFTHAGLPYVGTYTIAVSAPNATPTTKSGVKVGRDVDYEIVLSPGDGRRLTEAEAKAVASSGNSAPGSGNSSGESAAEKAKREELLRKNAEIEAGNKKIENANQVIADAFKGGNAALSAKNYDEAIRLYDEGLAADPEHPGIPALLTNKSSALRNRAVQRYNVAVQSTDPAVRTSGTEASKADFAAAAEAANRAVDMINKQTTPTEGVPLQNYTANKYFALNARAESMRLFVTKVDPTKADAAATAFQEYMAVETDVAKKARAQYDLAQMLFDAGAYDKAKVEYEKILVEKPDDPDALANMGLILFNTGALKEGEGKKDEAKSMYQLAANYLQKFVDKAPDTHKFKADAKGVLDALKAQQNVQAEKISTPPPRRRRP